MSTFPYRKSRFVVFCFFMVQSVIAGNAIDSIRVGGTLQVKDSLSSNATTVKTDSLKLDSLSLVRKKQDSSSVKPSDQSINAKPPAIDSVSRVLTRPFYSFGAAWGLGSYPLLTEWENALPDSVQKILASNPDTLGFAVKEKANSYNILFPIYLSYTPIVHEKSSLGFEASFFYIGKSLQATLQHDTLAPRIDYKQSMNSLGFSIGSFYRYKINERYFKIDKVDKTCVLLGLSVLPYLHIDRSTSFSSTGISDSVINGAKARTSDFNAWGMGASWRIGIGSQQILSNSSGMEISISYVGRYAGFFRNGNMYLLNRDINPAMADPDKKLSFVSSTVEIRLDFILGKIPKSN